MKSPLLNNSMPIVILMATYNGGLYLEKQVKSIISQTYANWELIIRDDGSKDNTLQLIQEFLNIDSRIKFVITDFEFHGACANFSELYSWAKRNRNISYLMFCDQDDIWLPNKVQFSLSAMQKVERNSYDLPVMLYGNLKLIDGNDHKLNSEIKLLEYVGFNQLLTTNYAFGCTMILNKALCDKIDYIPKSAENHDWWVALVATALGKTFFIKEPLILYRQHNLNVTVQGASFKNRYNKYIKSVSSQISQMTRVITMLEVFYNTYENDSNFKSKDVLKNFINAFKKSALSTIISVLKYKIFRNGLWQNLGIIYILTLYRSNILSKIELIAKK